MFSESFLFSNSPSAAAAAAAACLPITSWVVEELTENSHNTSAN